MGVPSIICLVIIRSACLRVFQRIKWGNICEHCKIQLHPSIRLLLISTNLPTILYFPFTCFSFSSILWDILACRACFLKRVIFSLNQYPSCSVSSVISASFPLFKPSPGASLVLFGLVTGFWTWDKFTNILLFYIELFSATWFYFFSLVFFGLIAYKMVWKKINSYSMFGSSPNVY